MRFELPATSEEDPCCTSDSLQPFSPKHADSHRSFVLFKLLNYISNDWDLDLNRENKAP